MAALFALACGPGGYEEAAEVRIQQLRDPHPIPQTDIVRRVALYMASPKAEYPTRAGWVGVG